MRKAGQGMGQSQTQVQGQGHGQGKEAKKIRNGHHKKIWELTNTYESNLSSLCEFLHSKVNQYMLQNTTKSTLTNKKVKINHNAIAS